MKLVSLAIAMFVVTSGRADLTPDPGIRFDQRLGGKIDPNLEFTDENGRRVHLGDYLHQNRPVMVELGYYNCPMLCGVILNALTESLQDFPPASTTRDFNFLFVGIDPNEPVKLAAEKRSNYLRRLGWSGAVQRWHFLIGSEAAIRALAAQVGFNYRYDRASGQYFHPSGLVILSSDGEIRQYLLGIEFPPRDLQNAIQAGRRERSPTLVENLILICCAYSPPPGSPAYYVFWVLRSGAILTVIGLVAVVYRFRRRKVTA